MDETISKNQAHMGRWFKKPTNVNIVKTEKIMDLSKYSLGAKVWGQSVATIINQKCQAKARIYSWQYSG